MLLSGSLPLPSNTGNGEKVLGRAIGGAASHAGQETIPDAAHSLEKNRLSRIVFNVTAQTNHEVVDGARIRILVHSPDLFQQIMRPWLSTM
jgi:Leucine-rich repeat (LRR) protein